MFTQNSETSFILYSVAQANNMKFEWCMLKYVRIRADTIEIYLCFRAIMLDKYLCFRDICGTVMIINEAGRCKYGA